MRYVRWLREYERDSRENGPMNGLYGTGTIQGPLWGLQAVDRVGYGKYG